MRKVVQLLCSGANGTSRRIGTNGGARRRSFIPLVEVLEPDSLGRLIKNTENEPSDRFLLRELARGDQDAATRLYNRYVNRLRAFARLKCSRDLAARFDPEDVVQSVFYRFFQRAVVGDYQVPAGEDLWKLLVVIAANRIRQLEAFHRARKRDVSHTLAGAGPDDCLERMEGMDVPALQLCVDDVLGRIPPVHRQVVQMRIEGFEVAEIAERLGRSERTVERVLQQTRSKLGSFFDGTRGEETS
jgi:RNA polymerase sigma-70 factor (ECF subfamily)